MRHRKRRGKLTVSGPHQRAMGRNLVGALFEHGRVTTTVSKAKAFRPFAEKLITLARRGVREKERVASEVQVLESEIATLKEEVRASDGDESKRRALREKVGEHARLTAPFVHCVRRAAELLPYKPALRRLFREVAPRVGDRPGGYTRILRLDRSRLGDNAPQALWELVDVHGAEAGTETTEEGAGEITGGKEKKRGRRKKKSEEAATG